MKRRVNMRSLATIKEISRIEPIEGADLIEKAIIGGWQVVVKKNEFKKGDKVVYFEIDSFIPYELAPFLCKDKIHEFNGVKGHKLRTVKLKGCLSQGLILPLDILPSDTYELGQDVSDILGIQKYEVVEIDNSGLLRSSFPSNIQKTDQERIQNLSLPEYYDRYEVTEKLEGTSCTIYWNDANELQVCSRNYALKDPVNSAYGQILNKYKDVLERKLPKNLALQGEICGPQVSGNIYGLIKFEFYLFDIYDTNTHSYLTKEKRDAVLQQINQDEEIKIPVCPVVDAAFNMTDSLTMDKLLDYADGYSVINPKVRREGLVFKSLTDSNKSFKIISNEYLLKPKKAEKRPEKESTFGPSL